MKALTAIAGIICIVGLFVASQATAGVALIGFGLYLAMVARIVQAESHRPK